MDIDVTNLAVDAEEFTSNAYLVDGTALIDTGADEVVLDELEDRDVDVDTVIITHSHWDHIENLAAVIEKYSPTVYAFAPDNLDVDANVVKLADEQRITFGESGTPFTVYHTPGHKDDHVCLHSPDEHVLFSGDLLFPGGSFGRTDLDEGDRDQLIQSIERIADLEVHAMYAGHDEPTTDDVNRQIDESLEAAKKREPKYDE